MCYLLLSPVPPHDMTTLFNKYAHVYEGRIFAKNILESTAKAILKPEIKIEMKVEKEMNKLCKTEMGNGKKLKCKNKNKNYNNK